MPTDGAPAPTAASAYSICTSFPDGLLKRNDTVILLIASKQSYNFISMFKANL